MTRNPNGKIARLPWHIREELNRRLENGEPGRTILPWLNALPEVQAILAGGFAASSVNQQNLSNWRLGGYRQWLAGREHHRLVHELVQDAKELTARPGAPELARQLSTVFLAELAVSARQARTEPADPVEQLQRLRALLDTVAQVRREDYLTDRLALTREREAFKQARKSGAAPAPETAPAKTTPAAPAENPTKQAQSR